MPTSPFATTLGRLAGVTTLAVGLAAGTVAPAAAQEAQQPAAQQAAPQAVSFAGDGGVVFWQVKPDKTADFEYVMGRYREALEKSEDATKKQVATGLRIYRTSPWAAPGAKEPDPGQNVLYLFIAEPAVRDADYSSAAILKLLYEAFPSEGQDLYKKLVDSAAGGRSVLNLHKFTNPPPAAPPAPPAQ
jgi:hypothetical protein